MNERTFYWNSPKELAQKVIKLDKIERRKFFQSLEMHDVPMGSLMGFTKIQIDDDGNIIGSNTFNALAVTAMPALVEPFTV